jgi:tocopherol O-methyltransferase
MNVDDARGQIQLVDDYYRESWLDYRGAWMNTKNRALHFGYRDETTDSHAETLERANFVLAELGRIGSGDHVLDAGCGVGGSAMWLAENRSAAVEGITVCADQLERARRYATERRLERLVSFHLEDYCATSFPNDAFDAVWAQDSVSHAVDKAAFLKEAFRVLRPGGRLVMQEWFRTPEPLSPRDERRLDLFLHGWAIPNLVSLQQFAHTAEEVGFKVTECRDVSPHFERSMRRLYRMTLAAYPGLTLLRLLKFRSATQQGNIRAAYYQWVARKRGLWLIAHVRADKPGAAT